MIEELKNFGIGVRNEGALSRSRIRRKLKGIVKKCHPIHQLIDDLGKEELRGMIWYSGTEMNGRSLLKLKRQLANVCFASQPDSPLSHFTYLQNQYRSIDPEDHKQIPVKKYRKKIKKQEKEKLLAQCIQKKE